MKPAPSPTAEFLLLRYNRDPEARFWRGRVFRAGTYGGVWVHYNPLNWTHRAAKRQYKDWKRRWGL